MQGATCNQVQAQGARCNRKKKVQGAKRRGKRRVLAAAVCSQRQRSGRCVSFGELAFTSAFSYLQWPFQRLYFIFLDPTAPLCCLTFFSRQKINSDLVLLK